MLEGKEVDSRILERSYALPLPFLNSVRLKPLAISIPACRAFGVRTRYMCACRMTLPQGGVVILCLLRDAPTTLKTIVRVS
jgi:hypothetical protein